MNDNDKSSLDKPGKNDSIEMVSMLTDADKLNNNKLRAKSPLSSSSVATTKTTSLCKSSSVADIRKAKASNAHPRSSSASSSASTDVLNNNNHHNRLKGPPAAMGTLATPGKPSNQNVQQAREDAKSKADNKKNELAERKKKEKARLKAEKEAKKVTVAHKYHEYID